MRDVYYLLYLYRSCEGGGPNSFLKQILRQPVRVRLKSCVDYTAVRVHSKNREKER